MPASASKKRTVTTISLICLIVLVAGGFLFFWKSPRRIAMEQEPDIAAHQITSHILSELKISDMTEVPSDQLSKHYEIGDGLLTDFSVYMSSSANSGDELACFRLFDPADYPDLERSVARHIVIKSQGFKELSPAEYEKIQKYRIIQQGSYVLVCVGDNADTCIKIFRTMLS